MKIGIFDPYLDDQGGGEKYMASIATCLSKNHSVTLFWDNKEDVQQLIKRFSLDFSDVRIAKNIFSPKVDTLTRMLSTKVYDVIIVLSDGSIPFSLSKKLFLHIQQPLDQFTSQSRKGKIKLSRVTGIFCNSAYTKSFNEKRFNIQTSVIYPAVKLAPQKREKENIVLTVGRFRAKDIVTGTDDYKKFPIMIEAFKRLSDKGLKQWKFIIATSVKEEDEEKFSVLERDISGYPIEFLVNLTNDALWEIYSRAKIYWHAAGYGEDLNKFPQRAEHFGISTVEAMGAGCVPVVINAGGQKEIVTNGQNGLLWDTIADLQKETQRLISDQSLWKKLSINAQKRAEDFSPEKFCEAIERLIGS
jgi:glycosyltransferase involved in cell wall biosynthesis